MSMRSPLLLFLAIIALIGGVLGYQYVQERTVSASITTFEACAAKYPVMESYPPRCMTPDGKSFTKDIGNELEYADEIIIESPRPNEHIWSAWNVSGRARGSWFFEGSFTAELFDENNQSLGTVILQAQEDWMTAEFVPFRGQLIFSPPNTKKGVLKIHNNNASDLPEHDKEITIPVMF